MFFGGDPFEHFGSHGGGGRARRPAADVDTNKLYATLGVRTLKYLPKLGIYIQARSLKLFFPL